MIPLCMESKDSLRATNSDVVLVPFCSCCRFLIRKISFIVPLLCLNATCSSSILVPVIFLNLFYTILVFNLSTTNDTQMAPYFLNSVVCFHELRKNHLPPFPPGLFLHFMLLLEYSNVVYDI